MGLINAAALQIFPGESHVLLSCDRAVLQDGSVADVATEYVNTLEPAGLPPHALVLKRGVPVILLRNLAPSDGLCNGTRLLVTQVTRRVICCQVLSGVRQGQGVFIPRITLTCSPSRSTSFTMYRHQFPLRLAFAMTINKSQGQSLAHVGIDLTVPVFSHGQLYVALSRATSAARIRVLLPGSEQAVTRNVVFTEVFAREKQA